MASTSNEAILYVLRELGRRAGAAASWIERWSVRFEDRSVTLYPEPDANVRIVFPFERSKPARFEQLKDAPPPHYAWMGPPAPALAAAVSDFVVPFEDRAAGGRPLFRLAGAGVVEVQADILTSTLWSLARYEESVPGPSDEHGRFPAAASAPFRFAYLDRPIVDEYGLALQQALSHLLPGWAPQRSQARIKISHDIDDLGFPFNLRTTAGHIVRRRIPRAFARDALSALGWGPPAYLESVLKTARISAERGFHSAFYWKASAITYWDTGYDPKHPRIRAVIDSLKQRGFEMGIHPAYSTFGSAAKLEEEVSRLREVLGSGPLGGRQHFLRWRPRTWRDWESAGLAYDSTVGFADAMGFKAGTAVPYHPWLIEENRESKLLEIPLIVMDITPIRYVRTGARQAVDQILALVRRCRITGGVFTLLWHNNSVIERPYASMYRSIRTALAGFPQYDWRVDAAIPPLPRDAARKAPSLASA